MTTLVFPASTPDAWAFIAEARARGEPVLPAASVAVSEVTRRFGELVQLPFIHDAGFEARFLALLRERQIDRIVCPVAVVHRFVGRLLSEKAVQGVRLIGESPIGRQVRLVGEAVAQGESVMPFVAACADGRPHLDVLSTAAVLRHAAAVYGESDPDKLAAMVGVFADVPAGGDVVEIGTLMGRTAFLLLALARRHGLGPVLVVDPWSAEHALQKDSPVALQELDSDWGDHERLVQGFLLNLLPFSAGGDFNYLRLPSHLGHARYRESGEAVSPEFGRTRYSRRIAMLHIDGNHDAEAVQQDCALWLPHLAPGGWLILDDYVWAHGDGPRRMGDALLVERGRWRRAFVSGKALFLQSRGE
jgi:SAM-dependent methyltransferase